MKERDAITKVMGRPSHIEDREQFPEEENDAGPLAKIFTS